MSIILYGGSGSPFVWRVWLALEHKALPYETKLLAFAAGDLQEPEFLRLNPRRKVPVIVDNGFILYESSAIVEYLDEEYPNSGQPLFPGPPRERAIVRRLSLEADQYFNAALRQLTSQVLMKPEADWDANAVQRGRAAVGVELARFEREMRGDFLVGELSAADFTLYPFIALALRAELKKPDLALCAAMGDRLSAWMTRIEALPYFEKTFPPHWKQPA